MTRQDYINNKCTHEEYYAQYVNKRIKKLVHSFYGKLGPKDPDLASVDLCASRIPSDTATKMLKNGDALTLGSGVCIIKEAIRQLLNA